jgi:glycosyltransferase involved in cell wall biosynthesis
MAEHRPWLVAIAYTDLPSDARVMREAREVLRQGVRVTMVVPDDGERTVPKGLDGAEIVRLPVAQQRGQTTIGGQFRFIREIARWRRAQRERPDVVHIHNMPDYLYWAVRPWQRAGTRVVIDVHDIMSHLAVHRFPAAVRWAAVWLLETLERDAWRRADHVITVHTAYRDAIVSAGIPSSKVTVVLNAPDPATVRPQLRRSPPSDQFKIVFHGTITVRSGILTAIRAMPAVLREVPHARLMIVGNGNARSQVHALIAELGLAGSVDYVDRYVPLSEALELIADAHVGVVPSEISAYTKLILPVKLTEYATLGIPAVATRLPLVETYFGAGTHMVDRPEPAEFAAGIVRFYREPSYREAVAVGAQVFAREHGWDRYSRALLDALKVPNRTLAPSPA